MYKAVSALLLFALFAPVTHAASLTADAGTMAQAIDIGVDMDASVGATGTPSQSAAGDDAGTSLMTSIEVTSDTDLARYEEELRTSDAYFAEAHLETDGKAEVAYYHDGHFFGIIPVKVKSHTEIATNDDGQVTVTTRMPWWNMFVTGTTNVGATIDSRLAGSGTLASDIKMGGNAAAKARILEAVAQAHAQARVSAQGQ